MNDQGPPPGNDPAPDAPPPPPPGQPHQPPKDAKNIAMLAHLLGPIIALVGAGTSGLLGFLGPMIIWLVKKDEDPFIEDQAKEALNFQITMIIAYFASIALAFATCGIGIVVVIAVVILNFVFAIIAAIESSKGIAYRYPFNIRLVS